MTWRPAGHSLSGTCWRGFLTCITYEETFDELAACRLILVFLLSGHGPFQASFTIPRTRRGLPPEDRVRQDLQLAAGENLTHAQQANFLGQVEKLVRPATSTV
jgi:hypothetical protein